MADSEIIMYESEDGTTRLEVQLDGETVWLTQAQIAELFGVDRTVVTKHLKNIYDDEELERESTCAKFAHVGSTGQTYNTTTYNLDAVISVGYRVNSKRATHFRQWATSVLRDYIIKERELPKPRACQINMTQSHAIGKEQLEQVASFMASVKVTIPEEWENTPFEDLLNNTMEERYAHLH